MQAKEAQRIKAGIEKQAEYKGKLEFLYSVPGYYPGHEVKLYSSKAFCKNVNPDEGACNEEPLVDLTPETQEQLKIYNEFILAAFNKKFKYGQGFSDAYKGFDSKKEKTRFEGEMRDSFNSKDLIEYRLAEMEKAFNYPACKTEEINQNPGFKEIRNELASFGLIDNLFAKIIRHGPKLDKKSYLLNERAILNHTHHVEIAEFYEYLKKLRSAQLTTYHNEVEVKKQESRTQPTVIPNQKFYIPIKAPIIALFCYLVNETNIDRKREIESNDSYCQRICSRYQLKYTDRVRQGFSTSDSSNNRKQLIELILPSIDSPSSDTILSYLNKSTENQKLYA